MNTLRNQKGFALGFVLILCVIGLLMTAAMLLMVSRGAFVSGQQMRFRTALEAGLGGVETQFQLLNTRGLVTVPLDNLVINNAASFGTKIARPTTAWGAGLDNNNEIIYGNPNSYDVSVNFGQYTVMMKIVDTVEGNSSADEGLLRTGVVNAGSGEVMAMSVPFLYTIEVLSQSRTNVGERSRLSVLYQY